MIGTDTLLNAVENIETVAFMETEVIRIAKSKGFAGILTTNTNPLTQVSKVMLYKNNVNNVFDRTY